MTQKILKRTTLSLSACRYNLTVWRDDNDDTHHVESGSLDDCYATLSKCGGRVEYIISNEDESFQESGIHCKGETCGFVRNGQERKRVCR
jgi:hypothetical protein